MLIFYGDQTKGWLFIGCQGKNGTLISSRIFETTKELLELFNCIQSETVKCVE